MSESDRLDECKKEIRSILISYQKGCMLSEFNRAYRDLIGRRLPNRDFGFQSDIQFLYSIPDVVKITPFRTGEYHLLAVPDEKSIHILKMVARQKPSKSKSFVGMPKFPKRSSVLPPRFMDTYRKHYENLSKPQVSRSSEPKIQPKQEPKLPPKTVSKDSKKLFEIPPRFGPKLPTKPSPAEEVVSLVQYLGNKVIADDLLHEYLRIYQKELSLSKYGYTSIEECISDIPELIVKNINNASFIVYHPESPDASDMGKSYNNIDDIEDTWELSQDNGIPQSNAQDLEQRSPEESQTFPPEIDDNENDKLYLPGSFKMKLLKVARKYSKGILSSSFCSCYEETTGVALDIQKLGYRCLSDLIDDFPDIFTREHVAGSRKDFIIYPSKNRSEFSESTASSDYCTLSGAKIIHQVIENIRGILEGYTEGISLQDFLHIYSINCKDTLCITDFGFDDLEAFLSSIKEQVPLKIDLSKGIKTVYMLQKGCSPSNTEELKTSERVTIPFDVAYPEFRFKHQDLPDSYNYSEYIPVYTSAISNPGHLYIQVQGKETTDVLVKISESMEKFYNGEDSSLYIMQNNHIRVGTSCVAQWPVDRHWYRAEILSIATMETVQVHYVDYGTRDTINKDLLRYIKKQFTGLPAQAIRCRLAYLKPSKQETKWNRESLKRVLSLCEDVSLMAKVEEVGSDGIYSIILCDTTGEEDVYINDVLCNEGLAEYDVGNASKESCIVYPPEPPRYRYNLDPIMALQAQYYLQVFLTVAPAFASNENFINLFREVSSCCSRETAMQNINSPSVQSISAPSAPLVPPGFSSLPTSAPSFGKPSVPSAPYSLPVPTSNLNLEGDSRFINAPIPPPTGANSSDSDTFMSMKSSAEACDIFDDDDDDDIFQEFCQKISLSSVRHVKRVLLGEGYKIHIIVVAGRPYASSGDISHLIWSNKEVDYLFRRLQLKDVDIPSLTLTEMGNENLFQQLEKFSVKGIKKMAGDQNSILLYPLRIVIKILNIFGHPSVTLRTKLTEEIASFDPEDPEWMNFSPPELVEQQQEENASGVTDDDKIEKLCLFDLLAMKESIMMRRKKLTNSLSNRGSNVKSEEKEKLEQLLQKVLQRIQEIKEICSVFA